jgi:hypothetical protein
VAAQVEILKLGANMGRALEQTTTLTTENEQLQGSVAALSDDQRIERLAGNMGLVLPPPGAVGYLVAARGANMSGALANIHAPNAPSFVTMTPHNGALVTGPGRSTLPPSAGTPALAVAPATSTGTATATGTPTTSSAGTTGGTGTPSATGSTTSQTDTTASPTGSQASPQTSQVPVQTSQAATTTPPASATTTPASVGSQTQTASGPPTGAAAIQPSDPAQQSGGSGSGSGSGLGG